MRRYAFRNDQWDRIEELLLGKVSDVGGKEKNKHRSKKTRAGRGAIGRKLVLGMRECGDKTREMAVGNTDKVTHQSNIHDNVEAGSTGYTDDHRGYIDLGGVIYSHQSVKHSVGEHVNGIESVWAVLKRGIYGTRHHVSVKHIHRYANGKFFSLAGGDVDNMLMDRIPAIFANACDVRLNYNQLIWG